MNLEQTKAEVFEYLNLYRKKLQEIQINQEVLAKNQALLAENQNKTIAALNLLIKGLEEEPDADAKTE